MLSEFKYIWDGILGLIRASKYRIELTSDQVPQVHSAPYLTGPVFSQLDKSEVYKMLKINFIDTAQT